MPKVSRGVWVTRPQPGAEETRAALAEAGYTAVVVPVLEIGWVSPNRPAPDWPNWAILVSQNAVEGLARAFGELPDTVCCAAVGQRTAQAARERGWQVEMVPEQQDAQGLAEALAECSLQGAKVWIPSGDRPGSARTTLPEALRQLGAAVEVIQVYETRDRHPTHREIDSLLATPTDAMLVHSPSAAHAIFASPITIVQGWRTEARTVAIGTTTRATLAELGVNSTQARDPSTAGILAALDEAFNKPRSAP